METATATLNATTDVREALAVYLPDESQLRVGRPWASGDKAPTKSDPEISRITVSADLPGLYCNMERVRVWVGDRCVFEAPMHMVEGVEYPLQEGD